MAKSRRESFIWARSAAGSALHSHCRGREFESPRVHHVGAKSALLRRLFMPMAKKDALARSLASPFRIEPAGLRFVFLSAILGIFSVNDLCPESLIVWAFLFFDFLPFQVLAAWLHLPQRYVLFSVCDSVHTAGRKASSKTLKTDLSHCRRGLSWAGIYFPFVARYTKNRRNKRQNLSFACMLKCVACGNGQFRL